MSSQIKTICKYIFKYLTSYQRSTQFPTDILREWELHRNRVKERMIYVFKILKPNLNIEVTRRKRVLTRTKTVKSSKAGWKHNTCKH